MDVMTFLVNGLSILLHGVNSLPDATSYEQMGINQCKGQNMYPSLFELPREGWLR